MNLIRLQYFIEAARCQNFSLAAQNLYTSQPNLSKQIALLEQELGFPLFIRTKRSVRTTPAGQYLFETLKGVPELLEESFEHARMLSRAGEGSLSIGILEGQEFNSLFLTRINAISSLYPDLNIELERNSFRNLRSGLEKGNYDLIVTLNFDVEDLPDVERTVLLSQTAAIAIHCGHTMAKKESLSLVELKDEDFVVISPDESPMGYKRFLQQCGEAGFTPRVVRQPRSLESLLLCVEAGLGIALLDPNTRLEHNSNIRTVPIPNSEVSVSLAWRKDAQTPHLENYIQLLTQPLQDTLRMHGKERELTKE